MKNGVFDFYINFKYFVTLEWLILVMGFFVLLYHKKFNKAIDLIIYITKSICCAICSFIIFFIAVLTVFFGDIGTQGNIYLSEFYINHMLPWIVFIAFYEFMVFLLPNIIALIKQHFKFGFLRLKLQKKLSFINETNKYQVFTSPNLVLLQ